MYVIRARNPYNKRAAAGCMDICIFRACLGARYFRPAALRNRWTTVSTRKEGAVDPVSVGLLLITFQSLSPDGAAAAAAALNGALP